MEKEGCRRGDAEGGMEKEGMERGVDGEEESKCSDEW
jgi:hypothetical protein